MTLTIPRKSMLGSLRGPEELVFDTGPGFECHGDTDIDPISRDPTGADRFDLVVIGSGPAGEKGANQAAYHGHRVAVVERRSQPGGASIAVAGMPVKTLRDTAVYLTGWSRRDVYGIGMSLAPECVMNRLRTRMDEVVETMAGTVGQNLEHHGVELIHGDARLGPDRTVIVSDPQGGERTLHARVVLLATGSRPYHPPDVPFEDPDVHDSDTILSLQRLPDRIVIIGGGPVGSEYASIFAALGVEVTLVDRGTRLLPLVDKEISEALADNLVRSGARLIFGAQVESFGRDRDGLVVRVDGDELRPQVVLHAAGRSGNVEGLGLAEAGVEVDSRGRVQVDESFRTTAAGIYAAGDVIGPPGLASVSMEQARLAMCRAFGISLKKSIDPLVPTSIYTLPEAAMVGLTEEAARGAGEDVETGRALFAANSRARIAGTTEGLVKLVFRASDRRLLGAHILGEEASELIHIAQAMLHAHATVHEFIDVTFNVPTRADAYKYAAYDALQHLEARTRNQERRRANACALKHEARRHAHAPHPGAQTSPGTHLARSSVERREQCRFAMPNGTMLDLFEPDSTMIPTYGSNDGIVFGFRVDDIEAASAELQAAGCELLCDIHRIPEMNYAYCHFRGPDGRVYGINERK